MLRYLEIKYQLAEMIASMSPEDALPSREALCRTLDTTPATLQKAINALIQEGRLTARAGSGTFVAGERKKTDVIRSVGVILPNNDVDSYQGMLRGLSNYLDNKNINLILCFTGGDIEKQNQHLTRLLDSKVSGIIIVPAYCMDIGKDYVLFNRLMQHDIPVVFCFRGIEGLNRAPTVCYNNFYGGYLATKHLISHGYRHIAYIERLQLRTGLDRYQGYAAALMESGLNINPDAVILELPDNSSPCAYPETLEMLKKCPEIDAVFCQADELIAGVYRAIRETGLRVSDDVGVIGFDDIEQYVMLDPPATSLGRKDAKIGEEAARILWKMMNRETPASPVYVVQPEVTERSSCLGPSHKTEP